MDPDGFMYLRKTLSGVSVYRYWLRRTQYLKGDWPKKCYFGGYEPWLEFICRFDFLKITNEINRKVDTFCGTQTSYWPHEVTGAKVVISFHSDNKNQRRGFLIRFSATRLKGMCGNGLISFLLRYIEINWPYFCLLMSLPFNEVGNLSWGCNTL